MITAALYRLPDFDALGDLDHAYDVSFQEVLNAAGSGSLKLPADTLVRTVTGGATTNLDTTVTSASGNFSVNDVGLPIAGTGIPLGATIASINSLTSVEISAAATATATGLTLTIGYNPQIGDFVVLTIEGELRGFLVERISDHTQDENGKAAEFTMLEGGDSAAVLAGVVIAPSNGVESQPREEDRLFSWQSKEYDASAWVAATEVGIAAYSPRVARFQTAVPPQRGYPDGGPPTEANARWIWSDDGSTTSAPAATRFFLKDVTISGAGDHILGLATDNYGRGWVGGVPFADLPPNSTGENFLRLHSQVVPLDAAEYRLAVEATNMSGGGTNPGGVYVITAVSSGGEIGTVVDYTDDSWVVYDGAGRPGMSPGQSVVICHDEGQTRGCIPFVALTFDADVDSAANAWALHELSTKTGNTLLAYLEELAVDLVDWRVDVVAGPTLELSMWLKGGMGSATAVVIEPATGADPTTGNQRLLDRVRT